MIDYKKMIDYELIEFLPDQGSVIFECKGIIYKLHRDKGIEPATNDVEIMRIFVELYDLADFFR